MSGQGKSDLEIKTELVDKPAQSTVTISSMQNIKFDTKKRCLPDVKEPHKEILGIKHIFPGGKSSPPNCELLKEHFIGEGKITKDCAKLILELMTAVFRKEKNVLEVSGPMIVCGDIHGQFYDLMKLFEVGGPPGKNQYLFLGDYVDRGTFSCEVTLYLYCLKLAYPKQIHMLRGNHECRQMSDYFNFKLECLHKYDEGVYELFQGSFDCLPLSAIIDGRFFCVHGGVSPDTPTVQHIRNLNRFGEPPDSGAINDLLWADPAPAEDLNQGFSPNSTRGCSYQYGFTAVSRFLEQNRLLCIIRGHEVQDEGYSMHRPHPTTGFPTVITVFSAANYIDSYHNKGAIVLLSKKTINIRQFLASSHPYCLPNFQNIFDWSLPFVIENVLEILMAIHTQVEDGEDSEDEDEEIPLESPEERQTKEERKQRIRAKIRTISRLSMMTRTLREEQEAIIKLKGLSSGKIPRGLLAAGSTAIHEAITSFEAAKQADILNECHPSVAKTRVDDVYFSPVSPATSPKKDKPREISECVLELEEEE